MITEQRRDELYAQAFELINKIQSLLLELKGKHETDAQLLKKAA